MIDQQTSGTANVGEGASAVEMRAAGFTYRQIAARMGVDVATAHRRVRRGLAKQRKEEIESRDDVRDLDLTKLAWLERRIMQDALDGDQGAARLLLACIQCRRQYVKDVPLPETKRTPDEVAADYEEWLERNGKHLDSENEVGRRNERVGS